MFRLWGRPFAAFLRAIENASSVRPNLLGRPMLRTIFLGLGFALGQGLLIGLQKE
jgi:hypothetical protein